MKAKDVLHLYLGQRIWLCNNIEGNPVIDRLTPEHYLDMIENDMGYKLILRPLSSMTEEEKKHIDSLEQNNTSYPTMAFALAPHFAYLLSKGFDIFNLHASGECLYEEDLTIKP